MNTNIGLASSGALPFPIDDLHQARTGSVGVVRKSGEYCLVAIRPVSAGDRLFRIEGEETDRPSRYSVQVGDGLHIDLGPGHTTEELLDRYFWRFMNHHCAPNALIRGRDVIARLNINPWEAVTFDYNTTEWDLAEPFNCNCGSPDCLGRIRGFRHLTPSQREQVGPSAAAHLLCRLSMETP